jgi:hypothetical protein
MEKQKEKARGQKMAAETRNGGFKCSHCRQWVLLSEFMGTEHRNHCPFCLWSKHVDLEKSGDRKSDCQGGMKPIGLTFKQEGTDKWGKVKQGELMLVHLCQKCDKISINRIAADDDPQEILRVWEVSKHLSQDLLSRLAKEEIKILTPDEEEEIRAQLFGKEVTNQ